MTTRLSVWAEWISLASRWGIYITSLFCLSFCFHSYISICFVYPLIFLFTPCHLLLFIPLFCSLSLSICSFLFTFCHTNHSFTLPSVSFCFLHHTLRLTNCVCSADPASVSFWHHIDPVLDGSRLSALQICSFCDPIIIADYGSVSQAAKLHLQKS